MRRYSVYIVIIGTAEIIRCWTRHCPGAYFKFAVVLVMGVRQYDKAEVRL